jgi:hypothetical protein
MAINLKRLLVQAETLQKFTLNNTLNLNALVLKRSQICPQVKCCVTSNDTRSKTACAASADLSELQKLESLNFLRLCQTKLLHKKLLDENDTSMLLTLRMKTDDNAPRFW